MSQTAPPRRRGPRPHWAEPLEIPPRGARIRRLAARYNLVARLRTKPVERRPMGVHRWDWADCSVPVAGQPLGAAAQARVARLPPAVHRVQVVAYPTGGRMQAVRISVGAPSTRAAAGPGAVRPRAPAAQTPGALPGWVGRSVARASRVATRAHPLGAPPALTIPAPILRGRRTSRRGQTVRFRSSSSISSGTAPRARKWR